MHNASVIVPPSHLIIQIPKIIYSVIICPLGHYSNLSHNKSTYVYKLYMELQYDANISLYGFQIPKLNTTCTVCLSFLFNQKKGGREIYILVRLAEIWQRVNGRSSECSCGPTMDLPSSPGYNSNGLRDSKPAFARAHLEFSASWLWLQPQSMYGLVTVPFAFTTHVCCSYALLQCSAATAEALGGCLQGVGRSVCLGAASGRPMSPISKVWASVTISDFHPYKFV